MGFVKDFIVTWSDKKELKEMSKGERANMLYSQIDELTDFFLFKRMKERENLEKVYQIFESKIFIKTLKKVAKDAVDDYCPNQAFVLMIDDFIKYEVNKKADVEIMSTYADISAKLLKDRVKLLKKATDLPETLCVRILVGSPTQSFIRESRYIGRYVCSVEKEIFDWVKDDKNECKFNDKTVKKIIKTVFDMESFKQEVLLAIATDRKSILNNASDQQKEIWNYFTMFLLKELNSMDKEELSEFLDKYIKFRKRDEDNNKDSARRIMFSHLLEEDYKSIVKVVSKMIKKDELAAKYL